MKNVLRRFLVLFALTLLFFLIWPSPIDPLGWEPLSPPPLSGVTAPNQELRNAQRLAEGQVTGPEDITVDAQGRIYAGLEDGRIVRIRLEEGREVLETFAQTGGRPLGIHFDAEGRLVVCDAVKGLLRIDAAGQIETLTTEAGGVPFRFTDDVDIASDGRIYFSDASSKWGHKTYLHDLLEARPHGRLLRFDPATRQTEVLLGDLYFANGIALSQNEDFVLVNETYRYRITRYWLKGEKAGKSDVFIDNLPGIPDGVSANRRGTFWVAMFTVRNAQADALHPRPFVKRQLAKMPPAFWPKPARHGMVFALDENGTIVRTLQDATGERVPHVTSAWEHDGWLYLGNLHENYLSRILLPVAAPALSPEAGVSPGATP